MADTKRGMKLVESLGATGQTVRANVRHRREDQRLSFAELSRRTAEAGRELSSLALRRIEEGARRVDVDDLMALAVALGTSPARLLLPEAHPRHVVPATAVPEGVRVGELRRWVANLVDGAPGVGLDAETLAYHWRRQLGRLAVGRDAQAEALAVAEAALSKALRDGTGGESETQAVDERRRILASTEREIEDARSRLAELDGEG